VKFYNSAKSPDKILQYMLPQTPTVRIPHMVDPSLHTGVKLGKADLAALPSVEA
jgi:hypothetical protein